MKLNLPGEIMMVGFKGDKISPAVVEAIMDWKVGGVILFGRNIRSPRQVAELCHRLQRLHSLVSFTPLLIAVDQEGGPVARFREGVTDFPGNLALGRVAGEREAYRQGKITGRELFRLGVNMNLAPVLDLYSPAGSSATGLRSLGSRPDRVAALGASLIRGMGDKGLIATAKHFPGKGRARVDSHRRLPVITATRSEMRARELIPFQAAISAGVKAIMTSHAAYPAWDGGKIQPATFSKAILTNLLRKRLGYKGLIITDDLGMGAVRSQLSPEEGALRALRAGADLLLYCHSHRGQKRLFNTLSAATRKDHRLRRRVEESAARIRRIKAELPPYPRRLPSSIKKDALGERIARRAITLLRDRSSILPLKPRRRLYLVSFSAAGMVEVEEKNDREEQLDFYLSGRGFSVKTFRLPASPPRREQERTLSSAFSSGQLIIASADSCRHPAQKTLIRKLLRRHPAAILIALKDPRDGLIFPEARTVLLSFGYSPPSLQALAEVISGEQIPRTDSVKLDGFPEEQGVAGRSREEQGIAGRRTGGEREENGRRTGGEREEGGFDQPLIEIPNN
ncbi:MAG: beta-N-acetylhexosaminidase [Euryarchaeota archaeon]|nr:beta-N-acetylhexosaminidase [Euryarchaeota archaeon]